MSPCMQRRCGEKHCRGRRLCAGFAAWHFHTEARALVRKRARLADGHFARGCARRALGQLRRAAAERRTLILNLRRYAARRALRAWAAWCCMARARVRQAAAVLAHRRRAALALALRGWTCAGVVRWAARARAELAVRRTAAARLARCVRARAGVAALAHAATRAHRLAAVHRQRAQLRALARLLCAWRSCAVSTRARAALLAAAAAKRLRSIVHGCLAALAEHSRCWRVARAARHRWARRTLGLGFSGWRARLAYRRGRSARMELALQSDVHRLAAGAWSSWHGHVCVQRAIYERALELRACMLVRWRCAVLMGWRSAAQTASAERCCAAAAFVQFRAGVRKARHERRAEAHWARCTLQRAVRSWRAEASEVQRERALLGLAARFLRGWHMRSAWQAWACVLAAEHEKRICELAADTFWRGRRLAAGLRAWQRVAGRAAAKRQRLCAACARLRGRRAHAVLSGWRDHAALQRVAAWAIHRLRARCLAAWRTQVLHLAALRCQAAGMGKQHQRHTLQSALRCWVTRVACQALRRARLAFGLRQHALYTARLSWRAWAAYVARCRQKRGATRHAAQHALRVSVAALRAHACMRRLAALCRARLCARRLASAFAAWAALAVRRLECRAMAAEWGAKALLSALGRAAAAGFRAWGAHTATMRAARRLLQRALTRAMRSSFLAWQWVPHPGIAYTSSACTVIQRSTFCQSQQS